MEYFHIRDSLEEFQSAICRGLASVKGA